MKQASVLSAICFAAFLPGAGVAWGASAPKAWGPMNEIEAAARKEGKLTVYAAPGHANGDTQRAVSQHFQQKYGIAVDWTGLDARDIAPRVLAEQRTKNYVADLVMTGYGGACTPIKAAGYIEPVLASSTMEKGVWRLEPLSATPKERDWAFIFMPLIPSFFINTAMVPPAEEPKSYQDLHPRRAGHLYEADERDSSEKGCLPGACGAERALRRGATLHGQGGRGPYGPKGLRALRARQADL